MLGCRAEDRKQKEMKTTYAKISERAYTQQKPLPNSDVVQTEARLARGSERCVLRGAMGCSRRRVLVTWTDEIWAICESSSVRIWARHVGGAVNGNCDTAYSRLH